MSFSDQKDSNISISGSSDPIRNVANSFAARPGRVGSAARYQDGKGDSSPEHVRTPQADDPDEELPDYEDDAPPPNNPFAGISNPPHQSEVKEIKDRESKHQPPPHDALHASVSAYLASLSTAPPPPPPPTPYHKYGQSNELKLPSRFQECSICFQKSYSKSTGANCSTCVYIICRSCFIQIGSSYDCPQCRTPTVSSAEILTPSINVDENALETMRVENINILAQLQAQGINPWIINITNMKRHIKNHQAALYEVLQYSIENPHYHLNDQKIKEAEYALEEVKKDVLPKIALIQQYIENEQAMEKARKIIDAADRVHKRIIKKTDGRIKAEARLRQGFDYSAYTASLVRPPSSNKPSVRQPSGPLVNGNGWIDGLYVGDGQS